jgi:hypothetical protein
MMRIGERKADCGLIRLMRLSGWTWWGGENSWGLSRVPLPEALIGMPLRLRQCLSVRGVASRQERHTHNPPEPPDTAYRSHFIHDE